MPAASTGCKSTFVCQPRNDVVENLVHLQDFCQPGRDILLRDVFTNVHKRGVDETLSQLRRLQGNRDKVVDESVLVQET